MISELETLTKAALVFVVERPILFVLAVGLLAAIGSVISETTTYWAARVGGRPLVERFSRWLRVDIRHMDRAEAMFIRWGIGLVVFGRILPGVRTLVSVPAGITRMNFGVFLGASLSGAYIWNTLLVAVSYFLGFKLSLFGLSIL